MASVLYHIHAKLSAACVNELKKEDACALWLGMEQIENGRTD
jgi:hypothetical protein